MGVGWCHFLSLSLSLPLSISSVPDLLVAECGRSWTVIGPSRLRPFLTPDPSSKEEVQTEGQMPFKPDELSDVTAADKDNGVVMSAG